MNLRRCLYKAPALDYPYNKIWYTSENLLIGPGIRQPISTNFYAYLEVLWNLNENMNSIYSSPVIRAGAIYVFPQTLKRKSQIWRSKKHYLLTIFAFL